MRYCDAAFAMGAIVGVGVTLVAGLGILLLSRIFK